MEFRVNLKSFAVATLAVFVAFSILEYLLHKVILAGTYTSLAYYRSVALWGEGDVGALKWLYLGYLLFACVFVFVYTRGYESKPALGQGLRYGMYVGLLLHVPTVFIQQGLLRMPLIVSVSWGLAGIVECIVSGIIAAAIYKAAPRAA